MIRHRFDSLAGSAPELARNATPVPSPRGPCEATPRPARTNARRSLTRCRLALGGPCGRCSKPVGRPKRSRTAVEDRASRSSGGPIPKGGYSAGRRRERATPHPERPRPWPRNRARCHDTCRIVSQPVRGPAVRGGPSRENRGAVSFTGESFPRLFPVLFDARRGPGPVTRANPLVAVRSSSRLCPSCFPSSASHLKMIIRCAIT
jgi:hypothetical protein